MSEIVILGGGISGLATAHYLESFCPEVFEKHEKAGGHCRTHKFAGCDFDEGPHLIFTKHEEVQQLFDKSGDLQEIEARIGNLWHGHFVDHPVIENLCQLPSSVASEVWNDFAAASARANPPRSKTFFDWSLSAYGQKYTDEFVTKYTKKYWQVDLDQMSTDWMGPRLPVPDFDTVKNGVQNVARPRNHYISKFYYPRHGGFSSILESIVHDDFIKFNHSVEKIDLDEKIVFFQNGHRKKYDILINTLPLTEFVRLSGAPQIVSDAADKLHCTSISLVNIVGHRLTASDFNWLYVYDDDLLSTRVTFIETLSRNNVPDDKSVAVQVEVYDLQNRELSDQAIAEKVCEEAITMDWIDAISDVDVQRVSHANVVPTLDRRTNLNKILDWLSTKGLVREKNDLDIVDNWDFNPIENVGSIVNVGRFAQWKYYWTDDCVLRAKNVAYRILEGE